MAAIGTVIDGKYEILKLVGKGGMSKVYLAMDKRLNKQWAVKEIEKKARDKNNAVVIQSAIAEANMIKKLDHPTLPRIVDIIDNGNVIYIVMDYIEGEALNKVLDREGAQPQEQVIEWAKDICEVLDYLHTRKPAIIYRDMKPANIMLKPDGNLKLIDFGIAREYKDQNIEDTVSLGTKGYAAPEQFGGKGQTDARTDIYCLGVTLYHLVTGQNPCEPPYELYPIRHWDPTLSAGLEAIIQKCTQLNPADRYQSCAELMYALEHYEEADESFKISQKKKLNKFIISGAATLACIIIGCVCLIANAGNINNQYEKKIMNASTAQLFYADTKVKRDLDDSQKGCINLYDDAIKLKPSSLSDIKIKADTYTNPYFAIIEKCCDESENPDVQADLDEALSCVISQEEEFKGMQGYGELSYKIAEYYLYYAPNKVPSKTFPTAKPWLEIASKDEYKYNDDSKNGYFNSAKIMFEIYNAYDKINDLKKHSSKEDNLVDVLQSLNKCLLSTQKNNDNSVKFDVYSMTLIALSDSNILSILNDNNITSKEIMNIIQPIVEDMNSNSFSKEKSKKISDYYNILQYQINIEYGGNKE